MAFPRTLLVVGRIFTTAVCLPLSVLCSVDIQPSVEVVREGGMARFECHIGGKPSAVLAWEFNQSTIPRNSDKFTMLPNGVLQIGRARNADAGTFRCLPAPPGPPRWSNEAKLVVQRGVAYVGRQRPRIVFPPCNGTVNAGETAVLECIATGSPKPIVSWSRADQMPLDVYHSQVMGPGNLVLSDVRPRHAGVYMCRATTPGTRNFTTAAARIDVLAPPWFAERPETLTRPRAGTARFTCRAEGNPEPKLTWLKDGQPLNSNGRLKILENRLVITQLIAEDEGLYSCTAVNSAGSETSVARLAVVVSGERPGAPRAVQAHPVSSSAIRLTWERPIANGHRVIAYSLHFMRAEGLNNEEYQAVIGNETVQYLVEDLEPATNYTFYLVAYMPLGASQMSEHITQRTLEDVPLRPPEPSISSFSPWAIRVSWGQLPGRVRRGHVTAYRLWVRPAGSNAASGEDRSTAKIIDVPPEHDSWLAKGLQENTLYLLRFAAATQAGWGEPSGWVTHRTPKVTTGHVPMSPSLHLDILNCTTIRVTWKRAVEAGPEVKGFRLFYREQENPRDEGPILLPALGKHAHLLTKLKPLTSYQIRLAAYNDDGEGYEADQIARTPECLVIRGRSSPPPPPPHRLHAVGNGSRSVVLRWSAPVFRHAGRCNYTVRCNSVGLKNASLVQYLHTTQEGLIVGGLRPHTHYEFAVRLRLGVLVSPWSPVLFHTTSPEPPSSPPDGVRVASVGPSSVLLAWQPPTEPSGEILRYVVRYATASLTGKILGFWRKLTTRGAETLMRVDGLQPGKAYQFQIAAATAEGQGPFTEGTDFVLVDGQSLGFGLAGTSTNRKDGRATAITLGVCIALACIVLCLAVLLGRGWTRRARPKAAGNARVVQAHGAFHQPPHPEVLPFHGAGHEDSEEAGLMKDCRQTAQKDWKSRIFCLRGQDKDQSHSKRHVRQSSCDGGNLGLLLASVASKGNVASTGACLESGSTSGCSSDHDPPSPPSSENSESSGGARFSQATLDGVLPNFTSPGDSDTQEDSGGGEEDEGVSPGSQHPKTSQAVLFNVPPLEQALAGPLLSHEAFSVSMPSLAQPVQALFLIPPRAGSCTVSVPT